MSATANDMIERIENQLGQLILYVGSIDALAEAYRAADGLDNDPFLFGTVYDALWDAAVIRIGALWDNSKGVASLPKLAKHLRSLDRPDARAVAKEVAAAETPQWERLKARRDRIVAHADFPLDPYAFEAQFSVNVKDLRHEAERVERILAGARRAFGTEPVCFEVLKSDATSNAKRFLSRFRAERS